MIWSNIASFFVAKTVGHKLFYDCCKYNETFQFLYSLAWPHDDIPFLFNFDRRIQ